MSLSLSSNNMLSSSSSSNADNKPPIFPDERERFDEWKTKMLAFLAAQDLISVVLSPSTIVTNKVKLTDDEYIEWEKDCHEKFKNAEMIMKQKKAIESMNEPDVIFMKEVSKCRKVCNFLFMSFKSNQMNIVNTIFQANA